MDISAIIYAAIGGGGGAAFGILLFSVFQKMRGEDLNSKTGPTSGVRGGLVGGLAVAGGLGVGALYDNMTLPRIIPMDDSALIAEVPIYGVIKKENPDAYRQLIVPIDKAVRQGGETSQENLNETRAIMFKLLDEKIQQASGDTLRIQERITTTQYQTYRDKDPKICTLLVNDEPFPNVMDYFSDSEREQEQEAMMAIFTNPPRDPDFIADLEKGESIFQDILLTNMADMEIETLRPEISEAVDNRLEHEKICELMIAYSAERVKLNDDELMNLDAFLYSSN